MKGNLYTSDRCPMCGGILRHDERRAGFVCEKHPDLAIVPKKIRVKFGREVSRRCASYQEAIRFLTGLRYKTDEGTFDKRDYKTDNPLGFETQVLKWLEVKEKKLGHDTYVRMKSAINKMIDVWQQKNVKTFSYGDFEDYLMGLDVGNKTRSNIRSYFNDFFTWLHDREDIPIPKIPKIDFELGWRNIIGLELQQQILDEVERIVPSKKIWVGIKWLATYVAIRPKEMRFLLERQIDVNGCFVIPAPKEKFPKVVAMLDEDIELYRSFPIGLPDLYFFRHDRANGSAKPGDHFSKNVWYYWWKKACSNLNLDGVDLYGGTRHSTASALGEHFSKEELREDGTMHKTNKAFERYVQGRKKSSVKVFSKVNDIRKKKSKILQMEKDKTK